MSCNKIIHDELNNMDNIICPFCEQEIGEHTVKKETCCSEQIVENHDGKNLCINCGIVFSYNFVKEYVDFHENKHKI